MARWIGVCNQSDLQPDSGVCALIEGLQIALFHLPKDHAVYAIQNYDPFGKANVLSRGIIGDIMGEPVVASPLYKQHFSLWTGRCCEDETVRIAIYAVRVIDGIVEIQLPEEAARQSECAAVSKGVNA
jgi:nitrite reductase (NADH) small subunit